MNDRIASIIEKNVDLIETNDFDRLYDSVDEILRPHLTQSLLDAHIDPLEYMNVIWPYMYTQTTVRTVNIPSNIVQIGRHAFSICSDLTSVIFEEGLRSVGYNSFAQCKNLSNVTFPDSLEKIGEAAFVGCQSFTQIKTPKNVKVLPEHCFAECYNVDNVVISPNTEVLRQGVFYNCKGLTTVLIPVSVDTIQSYAFQGTQIRQIVYEGTTEDWKRMHVSPVAFEIRPIMVRCIDKTVTLKELQ